jgi:hypothetical protein
MDDRFGGKTMIPWPPTSLAGTAEEELRKHLLHQLVIRSHLKRKGIGDSLNFGF